jgi:hypothetical protein
MANKRNRSQLGWLLFSIIINPVLALIILSFLGEKKGVFA